MMIPRTTTAPTSSRPWLTARIYPQPTAPRTLAVAHLDAMPWGFHVAAAGRLPHATGNALAAALPPPATTRLQIQQRRMIPSLDLQARLAPAADVAARRRQPHHQTAQPLPAMALDLAGLASVARAACLPRLTNKLLISSTAASHGAWHCPRITSSAPWSGPAPGHLLSWTLGTLRSAVLQSLG